MNSQRSYKQKIKSPQITFTDRNLDNYSENIKNTIN